MEYEDTSSQEQEQKKHVIRRDKVVVTKVTEKELSQIKDTANQCGRPQADANRPVPCRKAFAVACSRVPLPG